MTQEEQHAIDFAIYCTNWHYYYVEKYDEYMFCNAEKGCLPMSGKFVALTVEKLYKRFLKEENS